LLALLVRQVLLFLKALSIWLLPVAVVAERTVEGEAVRADIGTLTPQKLLAAIVRRKARLPLLAVWHTLLLLGLVAPEPRRQTEPALLETTVYLLQSLP
jgi:hypothetical protein